MIAVPGDQPRRDRHTSRSGGCRRRIRRRRRCCICTGPSATCIATIRRSKPCAPPASACWPSTTAAGATARRSSRRRRRSSRTLERRGPSSCATSRSPRRRVIYGHSLGGAVAIDLASRKHRGVDYGALIVESTFPSLADLAASAAGPAGPIAVWISGESFDSLAKIGKIDAPILMLHGDHDGTVPVALGRKLRDAAPAGVQMGGDSREEATAGCTTDAPETLSPGARRR